MKIPTIHGIIDRRVLVNFTADLDVVKKIIPSPFRPQNYEGKAIVGICLIRLKHIKPLGFPDFIGVSSENGAHRIAVEWDENGEVKQGVYIPRRDTSHWLNAMVGGRMFPGKHYLAEFNVNETDGKYHIGFKSSDNTKILVEAKEVNTFNPNSIFKTLANVSDFFEKGNVGYSPNNNNNTYDGLKLKAYKWEVKPLSVEKIESSFFDDLNLFAKGTIQFDNALLMKNIEHEWHSVISK